MKNLLIVALSVVVMLSGCAGSSSRVLQVDASVVKREYLKNINIQKAAEITREVLKENEYSITHFEWKANRSACIRGKKSVSVHENLWFPLFFFQEHHKYRTEIKITKKEQGHQYEVSSRRKIQGFMDFFPFRLYHRDEDEEKKILDRIEEKTAVIILFRS